MPKDPNPPQLAFSVADLPAVIALGRSSIQSILNSGALPSRKVGHRVIVLREDVETFLRNLPVQCAANPEGANS